MNSCCDVLVTLLTLGFLLLPPGFVDAQDATNDSRLAEVGRLLKKLDMAERSLGGDHPEVGQLLGKLAEIYFMLEQYEEAEILLTRMLKINEKAYSPLHAEVEKVHYALVNTYSRLGKYAEAEKHSQRALQIREETFEPNNPVVAQALDNLAGVYVYQQKYSESEALYRRSLEIRENTLDPFHSEIVKSLVILSEVYRIQGKYREAEPLARRALEIQETNLGKDHPETAQYLSILANIYFAQSKYAEAEAYFRKSLELNEKHPGADIHGIVNDLKKLAFLMQARGELVKARNILESSLRISENTLEPDHPDIGENLSLLGELCREQVQYATAREFHERGLKILEGSLSPQDPRVASALNRFALLLQDEGEYGAAREAFEKALAIFERGYGENHPEVATVFNNLAELVKSQGDTESAVKLHIRSLQIMEKSVERNSPQMARNLINVTDLFIQRGEAGVAREYLQNGLKIYETALGAMHPIVATLHNNLAVSLQKLGDHDSAQKHYEQALKIREEVLAPTHPDVALVLNNMASLYTIQGDYSRALILLERALTIWRKSYGPDHVRVAIALSNLALLCRLREDLSQARKYILESSRIMDNHIRNVLPDLSFAEQKSLIESEIPHQTTTLLSAHREKEDLRAAYNLIFRWKGLLIETLRRQRTIANLHKNPHYTPEVERLQSLRSQIARWYQRAGSIPYEEWKKTNDELTKQKEVLERKLLQAPGSRSFKDPLESLDLQEFRFILGDDEVFADMYLYSFWRKGKYVENRYAFVVIGARNQPILVDLGGEEQVNLAIRRWTEGVLNREVVEASWRRVIETVWQPLADHLPKGTRRVWVSPDGELVRIPWHLFASSDRGVDDPLVSQTDSARELVSMRGRKQSDSDKNSMLLVGAIDFNAGDGKRRERFSALPGTELEVKALQELSSRLDLSATILTGEQATKEQVVRGLSESAYVHLATHGFFYERTVGDVYMGAVKLLETPGVSERTISIRNPLVESGLALAGANVVEPASAENRGVLTAEELVGLDLNRTKLVTLSACETARGRQIIGQGVMGLRASMIASGAQSVLMSLWKVPDEATAMLMKEFYTNLWVRGLPNIVALRKAQEAVRNDPSGKYGDPINWAAWVLVGQAW